MNTAVADQSDPNRVPDPAAVLPQSARRLGYAGLIPFLAGALLVWAVRGDVRSYVALALAVYAALIVSFLGGIHWGLALHQRQPPSPLLYWGVVPTLVAWPAVMMPANAGLVLAGAMLLVCYAVDRRLYPPQGAAKWLTLRFRLSSVSGLSCFIAAAGA